VGEVGADVFDGVDGFFDGSFGGGVEGGYLFLQDDAVGREGLGYLHELAGDDVADTAEKDAGDCADERNGGRTGQADSFEAFDGGAKQEGKREGEGQRDKKLARKVEDKNEDREQQKWFTSGKLGWSSTGHEYLAD
jgi:hypothetical protein